MNKPMSIADWLKTHRKQVAVHGSILLGFLIYAVFLSGPLFSRFEKVDNESKLHDIPLPGETNNIRYGFSLDARTDVIEIIGWAFVDGQHFDNNQTYVVLQSPDNTYVFDTMARAEIQLNQQLDIAEPDLSNAGFVSFMAVGKVKRGRYDIGIYIREGNIEALQYTDKVIVKDGNIAKEALRESRLQEFILPEESGNVTFGIDSLFELSEGGADFVNIAGWAFIDGQSSINSKIYVFLASGTDVYIFDIMAKAMPNITKRFEALNVNLTSSGFHARIAKELIKDGTYKVGIYIKKDAIEALRYTGSQVDIAKNK